MVRTRAAAAAAPAVQPLAAAPRRRVKITPLQEAKTVQEEGKPTTTRSTRRQKASIDETVAPVKSTTKTRGGAKKQAPEQPDQTEVIPAKPKRVTRTTRATATTKSSEAKEKPTLRTTKKASIAKDEQKPLPVVDEQPPAPRAGNRKKVTFLEIVDEDEKENAPVEVRPAKRNNATKPGETTSKSAGLRAKPIRKPATNTTKTRATKRSKAEISDDESEEPQKKKIQRVLTPKKITQVAKASMVDEDSEDELAGAKTPLRNLSVSPRKPNVNTSTAAIASNPSPVRTLDFTQSLLQQSARKGHGAGDNALQSPARRPASPLKMFGNVSPARIQTSANPLASPARRLASPAKVLFPTATKIGDRKHVSPMSRNLFASPKRSNLLDRSQVFAQSAMKTSNMNAFSKSAFFSSPSKRAGIFTRAKISSSDTGLVTEHEPTEAVLDLNAMEVTQLLKDGDIEINVSSHQRASVSPMRTYKLTEQDFDMDFDDSVLPVRSPLKLSRSPLKSLAHNSGRLQNELPIDSLDIESASVQHVGFDEAGRIDTNGDLTPNTMPSRNLADTDNDETLDELSLTPQGDVIAQFMRTPRSGSRTFSSAESPRSHSSSMEEIAKGVSKPGSPYTESEKADLSLLSPPAAAEANRRTEREINDTIIATSPDVRGELENVHCSSPSNYIAKVRSSPLSVYEHELTNIGNTFDTIEAQPEQISRKAWSSKQVSPSTPTSDKSNDDADAEDHDVSMVDSAARPTNLEDQSHTEDLAFASHPEPVDAASSSPTQLHEHELTLMGTKSPAQASKSCDIDRESTANTNGGMDTPMSDPAEAQEDTSVEGILMVQETEMISVTPKGAVSMTTLRTPDVVPARKFNLHTVVSKVPLKPEAQDSPIKLQIKKRKRPHSFGDRTEVDEDLTVMPKWRRRTESSTTASSPKSVVTPARTPARQTPLSKIATIKSARKAVSTPVTRTPLTSMAGKSVLAEVTAYVNVRTSEGADASAIYVDLLVSLGAKVVKEYSDKVTHIVYKDGNTRLLEKVRLSEKDVKVVGAAWPLDCEAQKSWVDEAEYLIDLSSSDHVLHSVTKSARRRSMEPSMLIADGTGSVKRSKSRSRMSTSLGTIQRQRQRSINFTPRAIKSTQLDDGTQDKDDSEMDSMLDGPAVMSTPQANQELTAQKAEKLSLTAAWKSINANQNLGEDTPARRTLELLQKSYNPTMDDSFTAMDTDEDEDTEATPIAPRRTTPEVEEDASLLETGLTPAPYKTKINIGSAPSKISNVGMMSYRERVEEMERREMRNNAFGTNNGARGVGAGKKGGMRMSVFGLDTAIER